MIMNKIDFCFNFSIKAEEEANIETVDAEVQQAFLWIDLLPCKHHIRRKLVCGNYRKRKRMQSTYLRREEVKVNLITLLQSHYSVKRLYLEKNDFSYFTFSHLTWKWWVILLSLKLLLTFFYIQLPMLFLALFPICHRCFLHQIFYIICGIFFLCSSPVHLILSPLLFRAIC